LVIHIPLLHEGTDCWRPIEAEHIGTDTYRILGSKPEDEDWPVAAGDLVRRKHRRFVDGSEGLAVIISDPDLSPRIS
jgi:hypothetical protein